MSTRRVTLLALVPLVVAALASHGDAQHVDARTYALPIPVPARPFLLVQAEERVRPSDAPRVRVQRAEGDTLDIAVFRVTDPIAMLSRGVERQGLALADTPYGAEIESLRAASGRLPRSASRLTLVASSRTRVSPGARRARVRDESTVYDSYEEEEMDVETWGMSAGEWADRRVALERLPAGLYVVHVADGSWAGSTLLSVGELALLVRRGDDHDEVRVTDSEGAPLEGVDVIALAGSTRIEQARTDARGAASFRTGAHAQIRYVARRGDDTTFADVTHAHMSACDPRVYLGIGRPVFRPGETVHLRGHVRGCDAQGDERALSGVDVEVWSDEASVVRTRSDADGNFLAELRATASISARVLGQESTRDVTLDHRALPERALHVTTSRSAVVGGERFEVTVADDDGGWPDAAVVMLDVAGTRHEARIGPGSPARFMVTAPGSEAVLDRLVLQATLSSTGRVTLARGEVWTGARAELISIDTDRTLARTAENVRVRLALSTLDGAGHAGTISVEVLPSDGTRITGVARARLSVVADAEGRAELEVPMPGAGPWMIRASAGLARSELVVRDRPTPPALGARGPLAVQPAVTSIGPGEPLGVDVRAEGGGRAWVTLEQGSVWASELVDLSRGAAHLTLDVPARARGLCTVTASWVHAGRVQTASAAVLVRTSEPFELSVDAGGRELAERSTARVTLTAQDLRGRPTDAIVSVWMANAGYWELGEERYPTPTALFQLPGRPASAGDGSRTFAYGSEEGRHVDARLAWNGTAMPRATFRHAWGFGGDLVTFTKTGTIAQVVSQLAREAGLAGATFCESEVQEVGVVTLEATSEPWDLVALRIAERVELDVAVEHGVLTYYCPGGGSGVGAGSFGAGGGSGMGYGRGGAGVSLRREELLEGDLFFAGLVRLGPDGSATVDVPMPDGPGRWRIEALAIAADGGGTSAHAIVHTSRPVRARIEAPAHLSAGDEATVRARIEAPTLAGREATIRVAGEGLEVLGEASATVRLDAAGRAVIERRVRASSEGAYALSAQATVGSEEDAVRVPVAVRGSAERMPVRVRSLVGEGRTVIDVGLPPRTAGTVLRVRLDGGLEDALDDALDELSEPRWRAPSVRVDRLRSLLALRAAARHLGDDARARTLTDRVTGEVAQLLTSLTTEGGVGWWSGLPADGSLTAEVVLAATGSEGVDVSAAREMLRRRAARDRIEPGARGVVALALASADRALAARLLSSIPERAELDLAVDALRAAHALGDARETAAWAVRVENGLRAELTRLDGASCGGPVWFLCFERLTPRARAARAAAALLEAEIAGTSPLAADAAMRIARAPLATVWWAHHDGDADALRLFAALDGEARTPEATVTIGDRRVRVRGRDAQIGVAAGDASMTIELPESAGRFLVARVDGEVSVRPDALPRGAIAVTRTFERRADGTDELVVRLDAARDAGSATLDVPLPAGLAIATAAGSRVDIQAPGRRWRWAAADPRPDERGPRMQVLDGGVGFALPALRRGTTTVRVPLARVAVGSFGVGAAIVHSEEGAWGTAAPLRLELGAD